MGSQVGHFQIGWAGFRANWAIFTISLLAAFASWVVLELAVVTFHGWGLWLWLGLHLAFAFVFSGLMLGIYHIALQVVDREVPTLSLLVALFDRAPSFLLAVCLYSVAVACGLVLLVAPGVYLAVRYAGFGHVIASKKVSVLQALRESRALSQGRWLETCGFVMLLVLLNVAGAALLGAGLFVSFPVSLLAAASFFGEAATSQRSAPL